MAMDAGTVEDYHMIESGQALTEPAMLAAHMSGANLTTLWW